MIPKTYSQDSPLRTCSEKLGESIAFVDLNLKISMILMERVLWQDVALFELRNQQLHV